MLAYCYGHERGEMNKYQCEGIIKALYDYKNKSVVYCRKPAKHLLLARDEFGEAYSSYRCAKHLCDHTDELIKTVDGKGVWSCERCGKTRMGYKHSNSVTSN